MAQAMTIARRAHALRRKAEKLVRLAYELEADGGHLRTLGLAAYGNTAQDIAHQLGRLGRALRDLEL